MSRRIMIRETGEVVECPEVAVNVTLPTVLVDGREMNVAQALSLMIALRDYWRARALLFETRLGDARAQLNTLEAP